MSSIVFSTKNEHFDGKLKEKRSKKIESREFMRLFLLDHVQLFHPNITSYSYTIQIFHYSLRISSSVATKMENMFHLSLIFG